MRTINSKTISDAVEKLCIEANLRLPDDLKCTISNCSNLETSPAGIGVFKDIKDNINLAETESIPICQDTGMAIIFAEIGQEVFIDGNFNDAVNLGVKNGYINGNLRLSIVADPLERVNTNSNTPAIIHTTLVAGDKISLTVAPKGFGSENMSALKMFTPSATTSDIENFVVDTISKAGSNPCPPIVVGVGIGGDFEYSAILAKKALCRSVSIRNPKEIYSNMEKSILDKINNLGIGPQGFGGRITALAVNIEQFATHIAGLPVAVNVGCHVTRHAHTIL